ncbi:hypothetical protein GCM10028807_24490 [Spirosoma daeguense]
MFQVSLFQVSVAQEYVWAKELGGDRGNALAVDGSGNVYAIGYFTGTKDFDPGPGVVNLTSAGSNDIFVSKVDPAGNLIWAKQFGSSSDDRGFSIAVSGSGDVYITGRFMGTVDFDPSPAVVNLSSAGGPDIFIGKLDASGNYIWAKRIGGSFNDVSYSLALDGSGNVYTTGIFTETVDFDPGSSVANLTSLGGYDAFVSKLDASGNYVWAKLLGGSGEDRGNSVAVDGSGNVYTTGSFDGTTDFDPGPSSFTLNSGSYPNIFISKLDASGNFVWAQGLGSDDNCDGTSIRTDGSGSVYVTGYFNDTVDFDFGPGITNLTSAGAADVFIIKLNGSGNLLWAKQLGGTNGDIAYSLTLDASGNIYTTGRFENTADFDPGAGTFPLTTFGSLDIFVSKLDGSGNFVWAKQLGGANSDEGYAIAVASDNVYTTGIFSGPADFDPGTGVVNLTGNGGFLSKLGPCNITAPSLVASAPVSNQPISITATGCAGTINWTPTGGTGQANGNIYTFSQPGSYSLSATCSQGSCTSPASNVVAVQVLPASFAITSVNMIQCQQVNPSRGEYRVRFNPLYSGANANPISFSVVNEMVTTTNSGPYTLTLFNDNPSITLVATQSGNGITNYSYNWLASCQTGTSPNQAPTTSGIPNQNLTQNQPYQLNLASYFSDPDGQPLTFSDQGLPAGLSRTGSLISGTPSTTGVSTISITALDPGGLSISTSFQLSVSATPVTPPSGFAISGVSAVSCQLLSPQRYRVTFNPQYVGRDVNQPFSFSVANELTPTSNPGPYSLDLYTDNPTIRLMASQGASVSQYTYSWLGGCPIPVRQGVSEAGTGLQVRVLGNPVVGTGVEVEVLGAEAQPLILRLVNLQGQIINSKNLEQATNHERIRLELGANRGLLLLHVNTPTQQQQLKIIKH